MSAPDTARRSLWFCLLVLCVILARTLDAAPTWNVDVTWSGSVSHFQNTLSTTHTTLLQLQLINNGTDTWNVNQSFVFSGTPTSTAIGGFSLGNRTQTITATVSAGLSSGVTMTGQLDWWANYGTTANPRGGTYTLMSGTTLYGTLIYSPSGGVAYGNGSTNTGGLSRSGNVNMTVYRFPNAAPTPTPTPPPTQNGHVESSGIDDAILEVVIDDDGDGVFETSWATVNWSPGSDPHWPSPVAAHAGDKARVYIKYYIIDGRQFPSGQLLMEFTIGGTPSSDPVFSTTATVAQRPPISSVTVGSSGSTSQQDVFVSDVTVGGTASTSYTYQNSTGGVTSVTYSSAGTGDVKVSDLREQTAMNSAENEAILGVLNAIKGDTAKIAANTSPTPTPTPTPTPSPTPTPEPEPTPAVEGTLTPIDYSSLQGVHPVTVPVIADDFNWIFTLPGGTIVDANPLHQSWFPPVAAFIKALITVLLTIITTKHVYEKLNGLAHQIVSALHAADAARALHQKGKKGWLASTLGNIPGWGIAEWLLQGFFWKGVIIVTVITAVGLISAGFAPVELSPFKWVVGGQDLPQRLADLLAPGNVPLRTAIFLGGQFVDYAYLFLCIGVWLAADAISFVIYMIFSIAARVLPSVWGT